MVVLKNYLNILDLQKEKAMGTPIPLYNLTAQSTDNFYTRLSV